MRHIPAVLSSLLVALCMLSSGVFAASEGDRPYKAGLQALRAGKTQQALELLSQAINAEPHDHRFYNDRGVAYKRAGNPEMALADYTKCLQLKPDYTNALNNRGVLYLEQGSNDKAIQDFTAALNHGGLESKVLTNLGIARAKAGDYRGAVNAFEKAVEHRPVDTRSYFYLGESLEQLGEKDRALKMYQAALRIMSDRVTRGEIEKRIFQLERGMTGPKPLHAAIEPNRLDAAGRRLRQHSGAPQAQPHTKESAAVRDIVRAVPVPDASMTLRKNAAPRPSIPTLDALDQHCRTRALEKLSPNAAGIYRQGVQFVGKADLNKALIRFEDSRLLEKRNNNAHGFAWSSLEIARVRSGIGDEAKAALYFQEALHNFQRIKATDETILTLVELAANQKAAGQKDKAAAYYAKAVDEAGAVGDRVLAKAIEDLAAGKKPAADKLRASAEQPREPEPARPDTRNDAAPPGPVVPVPDQARSVAPPGSGPSPVPADPAARVGARADSRAKGKAQQAFNARLDNIGRGPALGKDPATSAKPARPVTTARDRAKAEPRGADSKARIAQPERVVLWAKGARPAKGSDGSGKSGGVEPPAAGKHPRAARKRLAAASAHGAAAQRTPDKSKGVDKLIRRDLAELGKLKADKDEPGMVAVLERLADRYSQTGQYEKALHGLTASLAFREKLGLRTGKKLILYHSGLIREKLDFTADALEDLTRGISMGPDSKDKNLDKSLDSAARAAANRQGLPVDEALSAFALLWKNRAEGDSSGETRTLHLIARMYEKAERPAEALRYYDRASASILEDKSRVYEKMGKSQLAEQALAQALEAFKTLDYSRYIDIMKKSKTNNTLSRQ